MEALEKIIGYDFKSKELLKEAMTHPSVLQKAKKPQSDNQRLEFLGDAVLQLILTEKLYEMFPKFPEGRLTKLRARLVSGVALHQYSLSMSLGGFIVMSKGEEASGGRARASSLSDIFESIVGAIYLDGGYEAAKDFVLTKCAKWIAAVEESPDEINPKGQLQEVLQGFGLESPTYRLLSAEGPDHNKLFKIEVVLRDSVLGRGMGNNKKKAEADAARDALAKSLWKTLVLPSLAPNKG